MKTENLQPGTYYFKDRDHAGRSVFVLVICGQFAGTVKRKAEANEWYRRIAT